MKLESFHIVGCISLSLCANLALAAPDNLPGVISIEHGTSFVDSSGLLDFARTSDFTQGLAGAAWLDYDNDLDLDVFIPNGEGAPGALFRNDGGTFTNVTAQSGIVATGGNSGALAGDINNDHCVDLYLTGVAGFFNPAGLVTPAKLFRNNCDGTFSDITSAAGLNSNLPSAMAAFGDINNDGFLDIFAANHGSFATGLEPNQLYLNNGDAANPGFTEIGSSAGIDTALGACVVNFTDHNEDGRQDILVGNCNNLDFSGGFPVVIPGPWNLFVNNGDLTFTDVADAAGLNVRAGFPMTLNMADIDNDSDLDIFGTGFGVAFSGLFGLLAEQMLFINNGDGTYTDGTYSVGLGARDWGWGGAFEDFDSDGDKDLFTIGTFPAFDIVGPGIANPGTFYENKFEEGSVDFVVTQTFGQEFLNVSGLASGDYDNDGFVDVLITGAELFAPPLVSYDGSPVLLTNQGTGNRSITLRLKGTVGNSQGIGARIKVATRPGVGSPQHDQYAEVQAGTGFASTASPWPTFGIGKAKRAIVTVTWPSGLVESFKVKAGGVITLVEGSGKKPR